MNDLIFGCWQNYLLCCPITTLFDRKNIYNQTSASRDCRFSKTVIFRRSTFNLKSPSILRLKKIFNDNPSPVTLKYFGDHGDLGEQFGKSRLLSVSCINSRGFSTKHFICCFMCCGTKANEMDKGKLKKQ